MVRKIPIEPRLSAIFMTVMFFRETILIGLPWGKYIGND